MIIKLIKYLGNDDNMSMMGEQFDMTVTDTFTEETATDDVLETLRVCRSFALWIHKLS